jgi:hypothetical protein
MAEHCVINDKYHWLKTKDAKQTQIKSCAHLHPGSGVPDLVRFKRRFLTRLQKAIENKGSPQLPAFFLNVRQASETMTGSNEVGRTVGTVTNAE